MRRDKFLILPTLQRETLSLRTSLKMVSLVGLPGIRARSVLPSGNTSFRRMSKLCWPGVV